MPSAKPTQPPAGDFTTFSKALNDNIKRPDGQPYAVFGDGTLPRTMRWIGGTAEYDGTGLRDVVNSNAIHLDAVEKNLNDHKDADNDRHATIAQRLAALEAAGSTTPFPGSS